MQVTAAFPPHPQSAQQARRFATRALRTWHREDLDVLVTLLLTELVTNSVLHARTPIEVTLTALEQGVRVAVQDGTVMRPVVRRHAPDATTGRGLTLVDQLGHQWGVEMGESGKTVWVEVVTDADSTFDVETPRRLDGAVAAARRLDSGGRGSVTAVGPGTWARCA